MKSLLIVIISPICLLFACESLNYVPPVTREMAAVGRKGEDVDVAMLSEGRTLFVHRCIECHTLPPIWHYSDDDWPKIVDGMSHRASLKQAERDAIVAYILAARRVKG